MKCPLCESESDFWCESPLAKSYYLCPVCKLVFMDPTQRPGRDQELERYEEHNNDLSSLAYMSYLERLAAPVIKYLGANERDGLDFGCGPVEGMRHLLMSRGFNIDSFDPYFFFSTKLVNNGYDFVLCSEAAEHFFSPLESFGVMNACLKKGGVLGVSSQLYPNSIEVFCQWAYQRDPTHVIFFSAHTLAWLAGKFGWDILNIKSPIWIFRKK